MALMGLIIVKVCLRRRKTGFSDKNRGGENILLVSPARSSAAGEDTQELPGSCHPHIEKAAFFLKLEIPFWTIWQAQSPVMGDDPLVSMGNDDRIEL